MPPKKYNGSWGSSANHSFKARQDAVNRVQIPEKVKCAKCSKIKKSDQYSTKQLEELRKFMFEQGSGVDVTKEAWIFCVLCTPGQVVELTCTICDKTMGLGMFSKTQRRDPDNARCEKCMEGYVKTAIGLENEIPKPSREYESESEGSSVSNEYENDDLESTRGGVTLPLENLSISGASATSDWVIQPRAGFQSESASSRRAGTSLNTNDNRSSSARKPTSTVADVPFNPHAYRRNPSIPGSARSDSAPEVAKKGAWAKPAKAVEPVLEEDEVSKKLYDSDEEKFRGNADDSDDSDDVEFVL